MSRRRHIHERFVILVDSETCSVGLRLRGPVLLQECADLTDCEVTAEGLVGTGRLRVKKQALFEVAGRARPVRTRVPLPIIGLPVQTPQRLLLVEDVLEVVLVAALEARLATVAVSALDAPPLARLLITYRSQLLLVV